MNEARRVLQTAFRGSDRDSSIGSLCGTIDGFDEGNATPAFDAVTGTSAFILDGCKKIFENGLVATKIADGGGRGTLVFIRGGGFGDGSWSISEICDDDAVVFENNGAFCA